jgi:hypothetical protein
MNSITLFKFENETISIIVQAYFQEENLIVEGYDIGKSVNEAFGDSDYEYSTTVPDKEINKLYALFNITEGDKENLLKAIARKFNTNSCYSEFTEFLGRNKIKSDGFSWT